MRLRPVMITVLHYTGYTAERGGIVSVIRALHGEKLFRVVHGVSPGPVPTDPRVHSGRAGQIAVRPPRLSGPVVVDGELDEPMRRQAACRSPAR